MCLLVRCCDDSVVCVFAVVDFFFLPIPTFHELSDFFTSTVRDAPESVVGSSISVDVSEFEACSAAVSDADTLDAAAFDGSIGVEPGDGDFDAADSDASCRAGWADVAIEAAVVVCGPNIVIDEITPPAKVPAISSHARPVRVLTTQLGAGELAEA